jgi:hypothetical protein
MAIMDSWDRRSYLIARSFVNRADKTVTVPQSGGQ